MVGLYAKMLLLKAATLKTPKDSGGPAVVVTGEAGDQVYTPEVWGQHGLYSMPPDGARGIRIPIGSEAFDVIVATHHYKTPRPTLAKGEAALASTSSDGTELKACVQVYADGKLSASNDATDLLTLLVDLIDLVIGIKTVGSPATHVLDPDSKAALEAHKLELETLLREP